MGVTCGQTNIPSTDNTDLPCEDYISQECIIIADAYPFIGSVVNESLGNVILKLVKKMEGQSKVIKQLKAEILTLKNN